MIVHASVVLPVRVALAAVEAWTARVTAQDPRSLPRTATAPPSAAVARVEIVPALPLVIALPSVGAAVMLLLSKMLAEVTVQAGIHHVLLFCCGSLSCCYSGGLLDRPTLTHSAR